jgi:hypothetical protein
MESIRRSRAWFRRALLPVALGAPAVGSLALLPPAQATGDAESLPFTRIAESARLRAGRTSVRPGDVAIIQSSLGAFRGSDIFPPGPPVSVEIRCARRTAFRHGVAVDPTAPGALDDDAERDVYTFPWVTAATWSETCRRLTFQLADGSAPKVFVWFGDPFGVVAQAPLRG